jgi:spermidine synthase
MKIWLPLIAILLSLLATDWLTGQALRDKQLQMLAAALVIICVVCRGHILPFVFSLAALMLATGGWDRIDRSLTSGAMTRSYFGIYAVFREAGDIWKLTHGTTIHGIQDRSPGKEQLPLSYYAPRSGIGIAMNAAPALFGDKARIGVVGLGTGTLACYRQPGQAWKFFEIDPAMETIARDPARFTYLTKCLPDAKVAIGDARLVLAREPAGQADLLAVDAFSSDAVPMHLLTQQAFATYGRYLKPGGLLVVHVSNRYLDLMPVVAGNMTGDWQGLVRSYRATDDELGQNYSHSVWIALSRDKATLDKLKASAPAEEWWALTATPGFKPWTDDFASILPSLRPFWKD